jgi:hypothetical protein
MKVLWSCAVGLLVFGQLLGQTFENIRSRIEDERIIIFYDLVSFEAGSKVMVRAFSSQDYFAAPLTNVTGDIGLVVPGSNRRIVWRPSEPIRNPDELVFTFQGDVVYELKITSPTSSAKLIRGKSSTMEWQGGHPDDRLLITLKESDQDSVIIGRTRNTGSFVWDIPKDLRPGDRYSLKISNENDAFTEQRFIIRRKIPLITWGVPILGAAVLVILKLTAPEEEEPLPDAPKPG